MIRAILLIALSGTACQSETEWKPVCGIEAPDPFVSAEDRLPETIPVRIAAIEPGPDLPFGRIRDAVLLKERVALADSENQEIFIVAMDGSLAGRQGGRASGDDQYFHLTSIARSGDGLVAFDSFLNRLTRLDPNGSVQAQLRPEMNRPRYHFANLSAASDHLALMEYRPNGYAGDSEVPVQVRQDITFLLVDLDDQTVPYEGTRPGTEEWATRIGRIHGGLPVVFGRHTASTLTPAGLWFLDTAHPRLEYLEPGAGSCFLHFDHAPTEVEPRWVTHARDSVRSEFARREVDDMQPENDGQRFHLNLREFRRTLVAAGLPARSTLPFASDLQGSSDGTLWLRNHPAPADTMATWVALDRSMHPTVRLRLGKGSEVMDFADDRILAKEQAVDGTTILVVYEF